MMMMAAFSDLRSHQLCFCFPKQTKNPSANPIFLIPIFKASPTSSRNPSPLPRAVKLARQKAHRKKPQLLLDYRRRCRQQQYSYSWKEDGELRREVSPNGHSKLVMLGAVCVGVAVFVMGLDEQRAMALGLGGPEGPLVEEFWDNMRRYALYILTVSTGVAYTIFQPILELLKNPISAILILTIFGGSIYIVSQVLSAMVGVSEFNYEYGY
ncbi:uncharacterized protein LOC127807326 [Diospyros lotus]|uniref:uncharacterized protein LOC127807326 n=1 Tax=Diospyros lotus TaxID=55363 RepID=UPI0022555CEF|nr:uncharacterized protein LOC127807326 [Diospyros lotus]